MIKTLYKIWINEPITEEKTNELIEFYKYLNALSDGLSYNYNCDKTKKYSQIQLHINHYKRSEFIKFELIDYAEQTDYIRYGTLTHKILNHINREHFNLLISN